MIARRPSLPVWLFAPALALGLLAGACSLGNLVPDACKTDGECAKAFGAGSECKAGYCTSPSPSGSASCGPTKGDNGQPCNDCPPTTVAEFHNACTAASCAPFDDDKRLTKLTADGGLPDLPPPLADDAGDGGDGGEPAGDAGKKTDGGK